MDSAQLRWWNGTSWTDQVRPVNAAAPDASGQSDASNASADAAARAAAEQAAAEQAAREAAQEAQARAAEEQARAAAAAIAAQQAAQQAAAQAAQGSGSPAGVATAATVSSRPPGSEVNQSADGGTLIQAQAGEVGAGPARYLGPEVLVVTTNDVPGYRIVEVYGEVFGLTVRARNAFSNMGASFRTMFGGEVKGYTELLTASRQEAIERLRFAAHSVGANAVVAARFDTGEIADLMNEVAAYGTAVRIEKIDPAS
jgi:uncharacterized protein YbjQ (UPF0145 family)